MSNLSLYELVVEAINDENINNMKQLLSICDLLHKGKENCVCTINNIKYSFHDSDKIDDCKYEELKKKYKSIKRKINNISNGIVTGKHGSYIRKDNTLLVGNETNHFAKKRINSIIPGIIKNNTSLMIMDGIQYVEEIPELNDVILLPKFDGCTIAFSIKLINGLYKLNYAHTRGKDNADGTKKTTDITEKLIKIFDYKNIIDWLLNEEKFEGMFKDNDLIGNNNEVVKKQLIKSNIDEIKFRCECVKKDKNTEKTSTGFVSGALICLPENFNDFVDNLCIRIFEIACIITNDEIYTPTQETAIKILEEMNLINYPIKYESHIDKNYNMFSYFESLLNSMIEPLDGIVYCNKNWTYPQSIDESEKRVNYGKYKFKNNTKHQSTITGIKYSIGSTGKITATLTYEPVKIGDKIYKNAKMAIGRLEKLPGLGVNCICDVELKKDINPMITNTYPSVSKNVKTIKVITKCPYCNENVNRKTNKTGDVTITCVNDKCNGIFIQKLIYFLNTIGIKGIAEKTLVNMKCNSIDILYREKYLNNPDNGVCTRKKRTISKSTKKTFDFLGTLNTITVGTMLIALGICTKTNVSKICSKYNLNSMKIFTDELNNYENLLNDYNNYFVNDVMEFLCENC